MVTNAAWPASAQLSTFATIPHKSRYISSHVRRMCCNQRLVRTGEMDFVGIFFMPFTLAHPAVVLPFRRFCPRFFNFPALVVGSICPDAGYCFGSLHLEDLSHRLIGSIEFCLPVGLIILGFFYGLRQAFIERLPERPRKIFEPFCLHPVGSPLTVVISLLSGIWIHLLLDSFTHKQGWLVENLPMLQTPVFSVGTHDFKIFNLLWYICSFAGVAWLYLAWEQWQNASAASVRQARNLGKLSRAALVGALLLPVELMHHLFPGLLGLCLTAGLSAIIVVGVALRIKNK
jgi:hypothetical protein